MSKPYLGLALGGGGARGAAHIGVIQALHRAGVRPDVIAGTSAGSTVGAMYAATLDPSWIEKRFREFIEHESFRTFNSGELLDGRNQETFLSKVTSKVKQHYMVILGLNRSYVAKREILENAVDYLLPVDTFEELKIPLKILVTDIHSVEDIVHESGDLKEAIVQSSSIPGFFEPTHKDGRLLVDGGVTAPLPVSVLKKLTELVMAIDISNHSLKPLDDPNMIEIVRRSDIITSLKLKERIAQDADILIRPDVLGLHWSEFGKFDDLLKSGRDAAAKTLKSITDLCPKEDHIYYDLFKCLK
jgi:NTE family protein